MFYPLGDDYLRCTETLSENVFNLLYIVNSELLLDHLRNERLAPGGTAFEPSFPERVYHPGAPDRRSADGKRGFFFYARPHNARNLYWRGLEALCAAIEEGVLDPVEWDFHFAGHGAVPLSLPRGAQPHFPGPMAWPEYAAFLRRMDIGLSLMYTPHPSYPPLDLAASGAIVVTNKFGLKRDLDRYSPNILCTDLDVSSIVNSIRTATILSNDPKNSLREPCTQWLAARLGDFNGPRARPLSNLGKVDIVYVAKINPPIYRAPWDISFDERMAMMMRGTPRAAYFYAVPDTSTFRYRAYNVAQSLGANGTRTSPSASWFTAAELGQMGRVLDACDVLVLCRNSLYNDGVARLASQARARNRRILFDVDDLVFDPAYTHLLMDTVGADMSKSEVWDYWFAYVGRVAATYALCDGAITTNDYLAARAVAWSGKPAHIVPNFLNREQQAISDRIWSAKEANGWARDGRTQLAYFSGSPSHNRDFGLISNTIAQLMDEDTSIWLRIVGFLDVGPELARHRARIETLALQDFINLQREIGAVELNLVPLQDNPFTNCKSELKWFEGAVAGTLTIASATHAYRSVVDHCHNGWLAAPHTWEAILRDILPNVDDYRASVVPRAREEALDRYGWDRQAAKIEAALFSG